MTDKLDGLVEGYLNDVGSRLKGVAKSQRQELLVDLQTHINQLRADEQADSEASIRNILDRLGSPETVAAAARTEAGIPAEGAVNQSSRLKRILIWAAVVVVILVVAIYLMFFSIRSSTEAGGAASLVELTQLGGLHG
jgi:uncharacterized membrane protein